MSVEDLLGWEKTHDFHFVERRCARSSIARKQCRCVNTTTTTIGNEMQIIRDLPHT